MLRHVRAASALVAIALAIAGTTTRADEPAPSCIPAAQCCKVCDKGKACGNSCIARAYTCHKGRGCACNASEVCAE